MHLQGGNIVVHPFLMRQLPTVQSLLKASSYVSPVVSLDVFQNREGVNVALSLVIAAIQPHLISDAFQANGSARNRSTLVAPSFRPGKGVMQLVVSSIVSESTACTWGSQEVFESTT